jgi:DNA-binding MarR family transcriptional regulator
MSLNSDFDSQVTRFHNQIVELIKKYQFRDRNRDICCGLSVSQCYVLETLRQSGPLSMNVVADKMHLTISTITRVIQPLLEKSYLSRKEDTKDRRVRLISLTKDGEEFALRAWKSNIESEKIILGNFPEENREMLIEFLSQLNKAVSHWQSCNTR